jgi:predicted DNA-binding transcriptional regulator AlpA
MASAEQIATTSRKPLAEPHEVASYLGVTEKTLAQWRWRRTGPAWVKVGGREVRYRWEEIDRWVGVQTVGDPS